MVPTVIIAVSLLPSLVAITDVDPLPMPRMTPVVSTVATAALPLDQEIGRASRVPFASRAVADNRTAPVTATVADSGVSVMDATAEGEPPETCTGSLI